MVGQSVMIGHRAGIFMAGADKRTVEIIIKIAALPIKCDKGEGERCLCYHYPYESEKGKSPCF